MAKFKGIPIDMDAWLITHSPTHSFFRPTLTWTVAKIGSIVKFPQAFIIKAGIH